MLQKRLLVILIQLKKPASLINSPLFLKALLLRFAELKNFNFFLYCVFRSHVIFLFSLMPRFRSFHILLHTSKWKNLIEYFYPTFEDNKFYRQEIRVLSKKKWIRKLATPGRGELLVSWKVYKRFYIWSSDGLSQFQLLIIIKIVVQMKSIYML